MEILSGLRGRLRALMPQTGSYKREVVESFVVNIAIAGINVVSGILLAWLLGPVGRGQFAAIQALPMIVGGLGQLGTYEAVVYYGSRERESAGRLATSAAALVWLASIPLLAISVLIVPWFLNAQEPWVISTCRVYLLLMLVNAIHAIPNGVARAHHRISLWNRVRMAAPTMWVGLVAICYVFDVSDPRLIAYAHLVTYFVVCVLLCVAVRGQLRGAWWPDVSLWPRLLRYGLPIAAGSTPQFLNDRIDQLLIAGFLPARELGLYALAMSWSMLAFLPALSISSVSFSKIAALEDRAVQNAIIRKSVGATLLIGGATAGLLALATPFVIPAVFGDSFAGSVPVALILLLGVFLRGTARTLQVGMQATGRPTAVMYSEWAGLGLLLVGMKLWIPRYGLMGAGWSLVLAALATLVTVSVLAGRGRETASDP